MKIRHFTTRLCAVLALIVLTGCASVPADLGRADVDSLLSERGQTVETRSKALLDALTAAPLSAESAVRIALINNPGLQASYAKLGFGAADIYEAGRIRNPVFRAAVLDSSVSGERDQVTLGLVTSFTDLITLRARTRLSSGAFMALKQSVAAEAMAVAAKTERAYYRYVGAQQVVTLRSQVAKAGGLSVALAERFREAGNLTLRELALQRAAASSARLAALDADAAAIAARTHLAEMLGLSVGEPWSAPAEMHMPLDTEDELNTLLALAKESRLDFAAARTRADVLADQLGVVNWTRWLGELDVGIERERETDGVRLSGPTAAWEIPVFNQHRDAVLRADTDLQIAINEVRRISVAVDNDVRLAYADVQNKRARIEEYRTGLIPQRIETVARAQEQVNFMLIGIFELIALKQDEYNAYQGYLEAIRDYWLARVDLSLATGMTLPSSANMPDEVASADEFVRPADGGMDHSGHGDMGGDQSDMRHDNNATEGMDHTGHHMPADEADTAGSSGHDEHNHGGSQ